LKSFLPCRLVCSSEPKAVATAEIVAAQLGIPYRVVDGLEEIDRVPNPIVTREEHERLNAALFADRASAVVGIESANAALARFSAAIQRTIDAGAAGQTLVVISHGTVISLFIEQRTGRDAFETWRTLQCGDYAAIE
jgi:broad specificity phosphatase PhoE